MRSSSGDIVSSFKHAYCNYRHRVSRTLVRLGLDFSDSARYEPVRDFRCARIASEDEYVGSPHLTASGSEVRLRGYNLQVTRRPTLKGDGSVEVQGTASGATLEPRIEPRTKPAGQHPTSYTLPR